MTVYLLVLLLFIAVPVGMEMRRKPMDDIARQQAGGEFAALSQGITHYQWLGPVRGPVVVCIHGLTMSSFVWNKLAHGLALMGYRVLIYDLYGRGYSDRPKGPQDSAFFLQQLNDLLADQQIGDDITLLGYSMGGGIATTYAAANPDKVRQMILLAPSGMGVVTARGGIFKLIKMVPVFGDWLMLAHFPRVQQKLVLAERNSPNPVEGIADLILNELRYRGYIAAVLASMRGLLATTLKAEHHAIHQNGIPVLAIWARDDAIIPISAMGQLVSWSRSSRQEVIQGAGHTLIYTHTDQILDTLRETLRDGLN